jgi:inner membrane protein
LDNLTHTLFAITLGRTPLARAGRGTTAALVLASNAPDIDIVSTAGGAVSYLRWHRGPTHGPLGVIGLGFLVAAIVWSWHRWRDRRDTQSTTEPLASFRMLLAVSMIGIVLHVLMDLPTSYGTRLLSPFSWRWFALDWLPIIDIYLLMALVAGMGFGRPSAAARRRNAMIVLTIVAANYGLRAFAHHEALAAAPRLFGPTLPQPCNGNHSDGVIDSWPRMADISVPAALPPGRRCLVEIAAVPTFGSPFNWRIIAQMSNAYELHDIDLLDARFRSLERDTDAFWRLTVRYPNLWTPAVHQAAESTTAQTFLGFSRFPAARSASDAQGNITVRWTDMRFVGGVLALDQPTRQIVPFSATVRLDRDGRIVQQSIGR